LIDLEQMTLAIGASARVASVDREASGKQRHRLCRSTVVLERADEGICVVHIAWASQVAGVIAPDFPLGGFSPLQSAELNAVAASMHATPMQIALAWLLHRAPNILLIPGTSSVGHLRENLAAAALELPQETIVELDQIASAVRGAT
jgi:diketogulonate reductase-like aldo/keto reductase